MFAKISPFSIIRISQVQAIEGQIGLPDLGPAQFRLIVYLLLGNELYVLHEPTVVGDKKLGVADQQVFNELVAQWRQCSAIAAERNSRYGVFITELAAVKSVANTGIKKALKDMTEAFDEHTDCIQGDVRTGVLSRFTRLWEKQRKGRTFPENHDRISFTLEPKLGFDLDADITVTMNVAGDEQGDPATTLSGSYVLCNELSHLKDFVAPFKDRRGLIMGHFNRAKATAEARLRDHAVAMRRGYGIVATPTDPNTAN